MAFCGKCGASVPEGTAFCGSCGGRVGAAAPAPTGAAAGGPGAPAAASPGLPINLVYALTYVLGLITGILFLVLDPYKNDRKVRFHCFQSIFFHVVVIAIFVAAFIVEGMLAAISHGVLGLLFLPIHLLLSLGTLCIWLFLMYKAYQGEEFRLPVIGELAAKQAGS
ncbi:MAG: hypothetical protein LAN84_07275 [Acidobacteriia bacterium]|nr:hypothetical protein [Terriglobia bacterium]